MTEKRCEVCDFENAKRVSRAKWCCPDCGRDYSLEYLLWADVQMTEDDEDEFDEFDALTPSAPERIWLQINPEDDDRRWPYPADHDSVSWCWESIGGAEVEYVRSDLVRAVLPQNWQEDPGWLRLAPLIGITE